MHNYYCSILCKELHETEHKYHEHKLTFVQYKLHLVMTIGMGVITCTGEQEHYM